MVQPPAGRFHESLWEIAQKFLGDGRRYREIFELNAGQVQPDGTKLTSASLIRPGWVLQMPRDARGPGIEVVTAPVEPGDRARGPASRAHRAGPSSTGSSSAGSSSQAPAGQRPARPGRHRTAGERDTPAQAGEDAAAARQAAAPRHQAWADVVARRRRRRPAPGGREDSGAGRGPAAAPGHHGASGPARRPRGTGPWPAPASRTAGTGRAVFRRTAVRASQPPRPARPTRPPHPPGPHAPWYPPRTRRGGPAVQRRSGRPWAAAARATVAAGVRRKVVGPEPEPALAEAAMRAGADEPSTRLLDTGLRYLSHALAPVLADPAHRVRGPSQPGEPGPLGGPRGPGRARAVDGGRRWPGVAAAGHRAAAGRAERGRRGAAAVPRPGHHRHRRHRAGAGRPGRRAGAHLGHRPGGHGHRRAVRDGHGAGHQPLVGPRCG